MSTNLWQSMPEPSGVDPRLILNGVELVVRSSNTVGGDGVDALAEGTVLATPRQVVSTIRSWTGDGDLELVDGHENAAHQLRVLVGGEDVDELDTNVRRLHAACRRGELVWVPPHLAAAPVRWFVQRAEATRQWDDRLENRLRRVYAIEARCLPHAYALDEVSVSLPPSAAPVDTSSDNLSGSKADLAARGWTAQLATSPAWTDSWATATVSSGVLSLVSPKPPLGASVEVVFERTYTGGDPSYSGQPLLRSIVPSGVGPGGLRVWINGVLCTLMAQDGSTFWHQVPDGITTVNTVRWQGKNGDLPNARLSIDDVSWTTGLPGGSAKELVGSVEASGTARTPARVSLSQATGTAPVRGVLVHVWPEDTDGSDTSEGVYAGPNVSSYRATGTLAADTNATVSGFSALATGSGVRWDVPLTRLPDGSYEVWALLRDGTVLSTRTITLSAAVANPFQPSPTLSPLKTVRRTVRTDRHTWVSLGPVQLPTVRAARAAATQQLQIVGDGALRVDQLCLTLRERADRPGIVAGTVFTADAATSRILIQPPTHDDPGYTAMGGHQADGSDHRALSTVGAADDLTLEAGGNRIYVAAGGASGGLQADVSWLPRGIDVPPPPAGA